MGWSLNPVEGIVNAGKGLAEVFVGNRADRERYDAEGRSAAQYQFGQEFNYRGRRNAFDSLIDGLNRIPRPGITIYLCWLVFYLPVENIDKFVDIMTAYQAVPELFWYLLGSVILFYFGGRMRDKKLEITQREVNRASAAAAQLKLRQAERKANEMREDEDVKEIDGLPWLNDSVEAWKAKQAA